MVSVDVSLAGKNIIIIYYIHCLTLTRLKLKPKSRIKKFHNSHSFLIITKTNFQPSNHYFNCHSQRNKYNLFVAFINNITLYHSRFSKCFYSTVLLSLSVQFSCSVMSDSLQPHGPQHARLACPWPTSKACSNNVHRGSDVIQPSHPLSFPSPPAFNLSQRQGLFQWVSSLHQVAKVLELQLQHQSFQWIFRTDFL